MSDEEDTADPTRKSSRRDRFKGAIARTKTKLSKKDKDDATTVDDFLSTGRGSTSTGRPSISDTLSVVSDGRSTAQSHYPDTHEHLQNPHPIPPPQASPRRIIVPKIDVSTSQRYPAAQPVQYNDAQEESSLLRPEYQRRSRSNSSLAKGRGRARGLSVQFVNRPPIVIGEGGDEAEAPPIEVGRAKARARSVSPHRNSGNTGIGSKIWNKSPLQYIPRPGSLSPRPLPQQAHHSTVGDAARGSLPSPGLKRIPTGMIGTNPNPMSESRQAMDKEFDMSLGLSPATTISTAHTISPIEPPVIHAPKPIHPPAAYPNVQEMPVIHDLKSQHGTKGLRDKFTRGEGSALRHKGEDQDDSPLSGGSAEDFSPPPGPPPGRRPPGEEFTAPPGPPPPMAPSKNGSPNNNIPPVIALRQPQETMQPRFAPVPARKSTNSAFPPPDYSPSQHVAPDRSLPTFNQLPSRPAPEDDYTGWVPDSAYPATETTLTGNAPHFPGVDNTGKLKPFFDESEDSKPEKTKKRWFRRGS